MTLYDAIPRAGGLITRPRDVRRVFRLLTALAGPSGRVEADVAEVARLLRMRPLSVQIALLSLSIERRIDLLYAPGCHERFAAMISRGEVVR